MIWISLFNATQYWSNTTNLIIPDSWFCLLHLDLINWYWFQPSGVSYFLHIFFHHMIWVSWNTDYLFIWVYYFVDIWEALLVVLSRIFSYWLSWEYWNIISWLVYVHFISFLYSRLIILCTFFQPILGRFLGRLCRLT